MAIADRISRITSRVQRVFNWGAEKAKAKSYKAEGEIRDKLLGRRPPP